MSGGARVWGLRLGAVAIALGGFLATLWFTPDPRLSHDSVLDALFDNRALVAGGRLVAAVGMLYLLASIVVRVRNNQWVRSAGSLDTDAPTETLVDDSQGLRTQLEEARTTIVDLRGRLDRSLAATEALRDSIAILTKGDERG